MRSGASFLQRVAPGRQEQHLSALKPAFIDCLPVLYMLGLGVVLELSHGLNVGCETIAVDSAGLWGSASGWLCASAPKADVAVGRKSSSVFSKDPAALWLYWLDILGSFGLGVASYICRQM